MFLRLYLQKVIDTDRQDLDSFTSLATVAVAAKWERLQVALPVGRKASAEKICRQNQCVRVPFHA